MALAIVQELLQDYLKSLLKEGVLSNNFCEKAAQLESEVIVEQIYTYYNDMEALLSDAIEFTASNNVDYPKIAKHAQIMEEKSLRIGTEYVRLACAQLTCEDKDKESLSQGLKWIKTEYYYTKEKLDTFVQMERKIIRLKNKLKK